MNKNTLKEAIDGQSDEPSDCPLDDLSTRLKNSPEIVYHKIFNQ